jgi:hypothetical protein
MTAQEELAFLESFKKKYELPYPFAVAGNDVDGINYAVAAIPTTVLIDRKGVVRYLGTGVGGGNEARVESLIEKLLNEK